MSPTIRTVSGREINLLWPTVEAISILDIAHGLANICRYTGQVLENYTVAQHSVLVSRCCPKEHAKWGLLHDANEAYLGDVSSPLKSILDMHRVLESRHQQAICRKFGLALAEPGEVKLTDKRLWATEERDLRSREVTGFESFDERIVPVSHKAAKQMFLDRFYELFGAI